MEHELLTNEEVALLAGKFLEGSASVSEKQRLHDWYNTVNVGEMEMVLLLEKQTVEEFGAQMYKELRAKLDPPSHQGAFQRRSYVPFLRRSWFRYAAAAAVIVLLAGAAVWYSISDKASKPGGSTARTAVDILPGTNKAILTIGNNQPIDLSNHKTGISIASNAVTYNDGERIADAGQQLTLTTPRGGQYQATLPDGSKVWLNAASSIQFPSRFSGDRREVEVSGEVYLEIAKNTKQPFFVHTNKATVQVLGTSFNVNAYGDEEAEKTTLIEGSIRVAGRSGNAGRSVRYDQGVVLQPGQQAVITGLGGYYDQNQAINVLTSPIDQVVAWRSGLFKFNEVTIDVIMRQLARWYDLEVSYEGNVSSKRFVATIPRNVPVSKVFEVLELTRSVHFKVEGNKVTVTP